MLSLILNNMVVLSMSDDPFRSLGGLGLGGFIRAAPRRHFLSRSHNDRPRTLHRPRINNTGTVRTNAHTGAAAEDLKVGKREAPAKRKRPL